VIAANLHHGAAIADIGEITRSFITTHDDDDDDDDNDDSDL